MLKRYYYVLEGKIVFRFRTLLGMAGVASVIFTVEPVSASTVSIRPYLSTNVHSMHLTVNVVSANQAELKKIGGDFATTYKFRKLTFSYMQPGMMRYEANIMGARVAYTLNGNEKYISIPAAHIHQEENVTNAPGKKQSLLDIGLVPPELLSEYNVTYLRKDGALLVFQIRSKLPSETTKDIIWMDPKTHITTRRMHFNRAGQLEKWFIYTSPLPAGYGVYVPSRVEVYNSENKLAAVSSYTYIKVNGPMDPDIFTF